MILKTSPIRIHPNKLRIKTNKRQTLLQHKNKGGP